MITRHDLEQIAHACANARVDTQNGLEIHLAKVFAELNPRFNENKFFNRIEELERAFCLWMPNRAAAAKNPFDKKH